MKPHSLRRDEMLNGLNQVSMVSMKTNSLFVTVLWWSGRCLNHDQILFITSMNQRQTWSRYRTLDFVRIVLGFWALVRSRCAKPHLVNITQPFASCFTILLLSMRYEVGYFCTCTQRHCNTQYTAVRSIACFGPLQKDQPNTSKVMLCFCFRTS